MRRLFFRFLNKQAEIEAFSLSVGDTSWDSTLMSSTAFAPIEKSNRKKSRSKTQCLCGVHSDYLSVLGEQPHNVISQETLRECLSSFPKSWRVTASSVSFLIIMRWHKGHCPQTLRNRKYCQINLRQVRFFGCKPQIVIQRLRKHTEQLNLKKASSRALGARKGESPQRTAFVTSNTSSVTSHRLWVGRHFEALRQSLMWCSGPWT